MLKSTNIIAIAFAIAFLLGNSDLLAQGAPTVFFGVNDSNRIELLEDTPDQEVEFFVDDINGQDFTGLRFLIQVGDGGASYVDQNGNTVTIGGTDTIPKITNVALATNGFDDEGDPDGSARTIFFGANENVLATGDLFRGSTVEQDLNDPAESDDDRNGDDDRNLIATVTFDTTGFFAGQTAAA